MSDKEIIKDQNDSVEVEKKEELSSADKILKKIKEKKEENADLTKETDEDQTDLPENKSLNGDNVNEDLTNEDVESGDDARIEAFLSTEKNREIQENPDKEGTEAEFVNYSKYSKDELLKAFNDLLNNEDVIKFERNIKDIKAEFHKLIEKEQEEKKNKFVENGGDPEDYEPVKDVALATINELNKKFINKKETIEKKFLEEKKKNLTLKYSVIEDIKELINKPESFNKTFNNFRNLQKKWNDIGLVPKNDVKTLWDEYNMQVQKFYEYVEVNKELRELDYKKNFDLKINFCEKAEELLLETNFSKAKKELQELHKKWKETGSVSNEFREELWLRFQNSTIKINENYALHIDSIKDQQEKNLESKQFLVEKATEYSVGDYQNHIDWKDASNHVIQLQKLWKKIGYVPKEHNNEIYNQFKLACDKFFERIREFYDATEKHRDDNYQRKLDLCNQAESLQDSNEWNRTADIYKNIQSEWKNIGPVPKKYSDEIWKRFRKACNTFFDRKKDYFKDKKSNEKENLVKKEEIILKIEDFKFSDNQIEDLKQLKEFQNEFTVIGYVPFESKDEIYKKYHAAIDNQLGKLNISREKQDELKFSENLEYIKNSPGAERLASKEMGKFKSIIDKLKDDIKVWENNIGFFSNSKNSESMINDINEKIQNAKDKVAIFESNIDELENIHD